VNRIILQYKNQVFFLVVALFGLLGIYVARITVGKYDVVVQGILGIAVLYLSYHHYLSPRNPYDQSVGIKLEFPKDYKLFAQGFILAIVLYWAGIYVLRLIRYLVEILSV
jgi:hypothetical protein